ncbi:MAG: gas vesicle protein [Deltaproteobacteria bacterium]|nr:gas vesicle protein [Deltaproteobacteria bacterium]
MTLRQDITIRALILTVPAPGRLIIFVIFQRKKSKVDKRIKTLQDKDSYLDIQKERKVTLVEVLDRVLDKGAVISGDIVISVADVDLVYIGLKVMLSSVETMEKLRGAPIEGPMQEPT